jgi:PAS domain S-box-containing protein
MKPLQETHPMGAFDQKGQLVYANTPLASVLGYKLNQLKHKNIVHLMPQPYGVLHLNCLKVKSHQ